MFPGASCCGRIVPGEGAGVVTDELAGEVVCVVTDEVVGEGVGGVPGEGADEDTGGLADEAKAGSAGTGSPRHHRNNSSRYCSARSVTRSRCCR